MEFGSKKQLKICVVEDDAATKALLQTLLSKSPLPIYEVEFAGSLSAALELLGNTHFDIVLLDLNLPDSKGLDTLVRLSEAYPHTAIVVTTGYYGEDIGPKAVAMGAQEYLIKDGYNVGTLTKSIRYAIERKKTHKLLEQKQKNLEAIFDAAPIGMLLVDENMIVNRVNDTIRQMVRREFVQIINQRVCGALGCTSYTYSDERGRYCADCTACSIIQTVESVLDSGQSVHGVEVQPTLKVDNKEITPWLCISAEPAMIDGCKQVVVAVNVITERKQADEKFKETMEMKSEFISTVSHELRTPLAAMKEGVTIVLDEVVGKINDKQRHYLDIARRNVDRLATLINRVLDFQRLERSTMRLDMQENDINEVVKEVYETMVLSAKKKGVDVFLKLDDNLSTMRFDGDKIIQVLTNLISNAIKFTPEGGQVSVCVARQGEEAVICVTDTGIGIPKEALGRIFERFYRVQRPGKQIQGTGLGLAIVKKIVMMHEGRIEVESEVGQGTTFTVYLPLAILIYTSGFSGNNGLTCGKDKGI